MGKLIHKNYQIIANCNFMINYCEFCIFYFNLLRLKLNKSKVIYIIIFPI